MSKESSWVNPELSKPEPYEEVLVWVEGKRSAGWRNNYALVAYINDQGDWLQERHPASEPIQGVLYWQPISLP